MSRYKDRLSGGLADNSIPSDFNKADLKDGISHEMEHTDDPKLAREIAMDHLSEDPLYYKKLKKIEESVRKFTRSFVNEMFYVTKRIPQQLIDDLKERGLDIAHFGPSYGWNPKTDGLTANQIEAIVSVLERRIEDEKELSPEESASNYKIEDLAIANVLGNKKDPATIQKAKILNMSYLIDDVKDLVIAGQSFNEHWDQHLDKVLDPGQDFPWNNEETPKKDDNPLDPYGDANSTLNKTQISSPPSISKNQRAGVSRGSGRTSGGRVPGGTRQGFHG